VAQETFVRAYTALARLRSAAIWEAWLLRITRNLCHDRLRRRRLRKTEPMDPDWLDGAPSPELLVMTAERRRQLQAAVQALPEMYRVPLLMRFESGCSRRDIAAALAVPESTVMGRLARAVRLLRQSLGEEG
jgi:RNA polymerase sigma-70 factor (ECF subfamily)